MQIKCQLSPRCYVYACEAEVCGRVADPFERKWENPVVLRQLPLGAKSSRHLLLPFPSLLFPFCAAILLCVYELCCMRLVHVLRQPMLGLRERSPSEGAMSFSPGARFPGSQFVWFHCSCFVQLIISRMPVLIQMAAEGICFGTFVSSVGILESRAVLANRTFWIIQMFSLCVIRYGSH